MSLPLGRQFLKYGNEKMYPAWSEVIMTDRDHYTGLLYAAIRNRANQVNAIKDHIRTKTEQKNSSFVHPYLKLINESTNFSAYWFWGMVSTYLDLEGVYYVMAVRNANENRRGEIKYLKLLNPYNIRRVINQETNEVGGYVEVRGDGAQREIPKEMIIEIKELNPFDWNEAYAMTDAAKESQFTLKTASDYTRHSLKNNINSPGIITTGVILPDEKFKTFKARMTGHTKGEPLFANGPGAIDFDPMQIDISKSALKDVNEINRSQLLAVTGQSLTMMGIEQSGTTRETGKVQKDILTEQQTIPRIQLILDSLNQDYKLNYPKEYETNGKPMLEVENPNKTDHEAEKANVEVKQLSIDLYNSLIDKGYKPKIAAKYVAGEIDIESLGKPTEPVKEVEPEVAPPVKKKSKEKLNKKLNQRQLIQNQEAVLENAIINIDEVLITKAINRIPKLIKNAIDSESDLLTLTDKRLAKNELQVVLNLFYNTVMVIEGEAHMDNRGEELGIVGDFALDAGIKQVLAALSDKVSTSHIDTVSNDIYQRARELALQEKSQQEIISALTQTFTRDVSTIRARAVARTETQRAFTTSQFEADKQLIEQNGLVDRAYKKWRTNSDNPCPICEQLASEDAIPLFDAFRELDSVVSYKEGGKQKSYKVNFDSLEAGTAHPNCSCDYDLIIRKEKKTDA